MAFRASHIARVRDCFYGTFVLDIQRTDGASEHVAGIGKAEFDIIFGEGISRTGEIVDLGADMNIIKKSGSWYSYNDTKLAQGREAAKQCIKDNPELAEELSGLIMEELKKRK